MNTYMYPHGSFVGTPTASNCLLHLQKLDRPVASKVPAVNVKPWQNEHFKRWTKAIPREGTFGTKAWRSVQQKVRPGESWQELWIPPLIWYVKTNVPYAPPNPAHWIFASSCTIMMPIGQFPNGSRGQQRHMGQAACFQKACFTQH